MTIYYVDPINGNDLNAGTSFATRKKTFNFSLQPGDEARLIASPEPTSMWQDATWTNSSNNVILTSAVTGDITAANTAWTPTTNASSTTSSNRKLGTTSSSISVTATFTTGRAAYLNLGSAQDLSAYQQVSFWINMTSGSMTADGDISLRLCSDTTGDVTVNTIPVPRIRATGQWQAYTVDLGSALGSNIQSIALYIEQDRGAQTFLLNNIIACRAASEPDSLSLTSLISKNTTDEPWWAIMSITGTNVVLSSGVFTGLSSVQSLGYGGETATQTLYKREIIQLPSSMISTSSTAISFISTNNPNAIYTGGWNTTDMSTQTGSTYVSGVNGYGIGVNLNYSGAVISNINPYNFYYGFQFTQPATITASDTGNHNLHGVYYANNNSVKSLINITNIIQNGSSGVQGSYGKMNKFTIVNLLANRYSGIYADVISSNNVYTITNCNNNGTTSGTGGLIVNQATANKFNIVNLKRNWANTYTTVSSFNTYNLTGEIITYNTTNTNSYCFFITTSIKEIYDLSGATITQSSTNTNGLIHSFNGATATFKNGIYNLFNSSSVLYSQASNAGALSNVIIDNPTVIGGAALPFNFNNVASNLQYSRPNGVINDSRYYTSSGGLFQPNTAIRHTASGISWKWTPSTFANFQSTEDFPSVFPVATVAVNAGLETTASIWVYRTDATNRVQLVCTGGQIEGVDTDVIANAAGSLNAWEKLTIAFTPGAVGAVAIEIRCYQTTGSSGNVYIDDFIVEAV